jgi:rhodanese-related sulfurtransferase
MKRAALELAILIGLMLVAGTAYTLAIRGSAEKALPWVSPVLPRGWPEIPTPTVADAGHDGNGGSTGSSLGTGPETSSSETPERTGAVGAGQPVGKADPSGEASTLSTDVEPVEPAAEPAGPFRFIDHDEVLRHYEDGVAIFIDARRTRDFVAGHIQGARSISYWEADADEKIGALREEVPLEIPIVVYCTRSKDCEDSQFLAQKLHDIGFLDLMVYRGGFPEWKEKEPTRVVTGRAPGDK